MVINTSEIDQNGWVKDKCAAGATASLLVAWQCIAKGYRIFKVEVTSLFWFSAHTQSRLKIHQILRCNATMCFPGSVQVLQAVSANNANPGRHLLWLLNKIVTRTPILPCFETVKYPLNDENKRLSSTHGQPTEGDMIPHYLVFISTWRGPVSPPCPKCFHPSETKLLFTLRADSEHSSFLLHSSQTF